MSHTRCHKCDISFIKLHTLPVASTDKLNKSVVESFAYFSDYVVVVKWLTLLPRRWKVSGSNTALVNVLIS